MSASTLRRSHPSGPGLVEERHIVSHHVPMRAKCSTFRRDYGLIVRCPMLSASGVQRLEQCTGGIVDEQLAVANVAAKHRVVGVAGLRPDLEGRYARLRGAGGEAGAQAAAGEAG